MPVGDTCFQQAFEALLSRAPGPVFPRARQLYLRKYPLEGRPTAGEAPPAGRFRTFLLQEELEEQPAGVLLVRARRFAVVHWQAPQTNPADYLHYLRSRWILAPVDLELVQASWFREGGAWAAFTASALYRSSPLTDR